MNTLNRFSLPPPSPRPISKDIAAVSQPVAEDSVAAFGEEIQHELDQLEERFARFTTQQSTLISLRRRVR